MSEQKLAEKCTHCNGAGYIKKFYGCFMYHEICVYCDGKGHV